MASPVAAVRMMYMYDQELISLRLLMSSWYEVLAPSFGVIGTLKYHSNSFKIVVKCYWLLLSLIAILNDGHIMCNRLKLSFFKKVTVVLVY